MVQIKLFRDHTPEMEKFEKQVNNFLCEHKDMIIVKDIKYTADYVNPNNSAWQNWTAMVIYEVVGDNVE
jgi:hypothetical protein